MNNKGFTLVEVLAVVVILTLVIFLTSRSVLKAIENSKLKSEELFVAKVGNFIEDYLDYVGLNSSSLVKDSAYLSKPIVFEKCYDYDEIGDCKSDSSITATAYLMENSDSSIITLKDLVKTGLVSESDFLNPRTREKCQNLDSTRIYLFKDNDSVYYYFVDLNSSCGVRKEDNVNIISTIPKGFCTKIESSTEEESENRLELILGSGNSEIICE